MGLGAVAAWRFVPFDLNPLHLQNQRVESVVWEYKLIQDSKYSTSYGAVATSSLDELQDRIEALKQLPTVSHVESILSFLPSEVDAKRPLLEKLRPVLSSIKFSGEPASVSGPAELAAILSRINFKIGEAARSLQEEKAATAGQIEETHGLINRIIPLLNGNQPAQIAARLANFERQFIADLQEKWGLVGGYVKSALDTPAPTLADLPQAVRQRFISDQGTFLLRVFPSQDIWNFDPLKLFVKSLWGVDPNAVGDPVLLYVFTLGFRNACLKAAGVALLAIAAMLLVLFRSWKMTLLAFLPLIVGTGLTLMPDVAVGHFLQSGQCLVCAPDPGRGDRIRHHHLDALASGRVGPVHHPAGQHRQGRGPGGPDHHGGLRQFDGFRPPGGLQPGSAGYGGQSQRLGGFFKLSPGLYPGNGKRIRAPGTFVPSLPRDGPLVQSHGEEKDP